MNWVLVAIGSAIGGLLRYALARLLPPGDGWPLATLTANLAGCFAIGVLYAWIAARGANAENVRLFWMTGVLGGFTTYSAFALESSVLGSAGNVALALGYVAVTVVGCIALAFAGRAFGSLWW
jgi:fluoride exporter